jgi:hypothetical protein
MKMRQTNSGKYKLTLNHDELSVINSILNHVRLGTTENSEVVCELITLCDNYALDYHPITVDIGRDGYKDDEVTINV